MFGKVFPGRFRLLLASREIQLQSTVGFTVFPTSDGCSPKCIPCPSHVKEHVPRPSQGLHTVLTMCTCQGVVPTHWLICCLTLRVPPLLGGGDGVSDGGSEGLTVSSASASSSKNTSAYPIPKSKSSSSSSSSDLRSPNSNSLSQQGF